MLSAVLEADVPLDDPANVYQYGFVFDSDGDTTLDCLDDCPDDPGKTAPGTCVCGVPDDGADSDSDGTIDCLDPCPTVDPFNPPP